MDDKEFAERSQHELAVIEAAIEAVAETSDIDFVTQGGILEVECADGSKVIVSPHGIAKEIWIAAKSGGFHFRYDPVTGAWVDTRTGDLLRARLVEILQQQGQVALRLS
jgi:CyaY protein